MKILQKFHINNSSIQGKIMLLATVTLITMTVVLTAISVHYIRSASEAALEKSMRETAKIAANRVGGYVELKKSIVQSMAFRTGSRCDGLLSQPFSEANAAQVEEFVNSLSRTFNFDLAFVIDRDGMARTRTHTNFAKLLPEYYTKIIVDKLPVYMSDVVRDNRMKNVTVINYSAPIYNDSHKFLGVLVCKAKAQYLSDLVKDINVGKYGSTFITNTDGQCIAHKDKERLMGGKSETKYKNNPEYKTLNALWTAMKQNDRGFMQYDFDGARYAAYDTAPGTNNWTVAATASKEEFMESSGSAIKASILVSILLLALAFVAVVFSVRTIIGRIVWITDRIEALSMGDLTDNVKPDKGNDEVSTLINSSGRLIHSIHNIIESLSTSLNKMAAGNLDAEVSGSFPGDFLQLKKIVERNFEKLADIVQHISRTSEEVSRGSAQIADSASSLAQGAAEQAGSVEELHGTVAELSTRAKGIANPQEKRLVDDSDEDVSEEEEEKRIETEPTLVDKLIAAMSNIDHRLSEIRKTYNVIEDIASETGMLALNAAVEASHAGEYGKGFAVIASEIRELSEKSKIEAANSYEQLDKINRSVERGNKVVGFTVNSVQEISMSLAQVEAALAQISTVIEGTAATAEESAASSEELSAQAEALKTLSSGFIVKNKHEDKHSETQEAQAIHEETAQVHNILKGLKHLVKNNNSQEEDKQ